MTCAAPPKCRTSMLKGILGDYEVNLYCIGVLKKERNYFLQKSIILNG